jgi:hypothetical protein
MKKALIVTTVAFVLMSLCDIYSIISNWGNNQMVLAGGSNLIILINWYIMCQLYFRTAAKTDELIVENYSAKTALLTILDEVGYDISEQKNHKLDDIVSHIRNIQ